MKNNQIGIIGLGYWGTNIVNVLLKLGVNEIYCFDKNYENLKEIKKKFPRVKTIKDLNVLLKIKPNGVIISVDTKHHYAMAKKCLLSNLNVFIEKPVTNNPIKLKKLINIAKSQKKIIMSGYIYFYNDHIRYIKNLILKKKLGKILYVSFERSNLGPVRSDISSVWDLSSHDIGILKYFFKDQIKVINFLGHDILKKRIYDISQFSCKINEVKVDFKSSWLSPEKIRKIIIIGKKKMLLYNELDFESPVKIFNKYAEYPKVGKFSKKFFTQKANIYLGKTYIPKIKSRSPLENEMLEFLKCLKNQSTPMTSTSLSLDIHNILKKLN